MFENVPREKVLEVVKAKGPTIPVRIVKEVGGNTFVIGAVLSDLINAKMVRATQYLKIGGTPIYYVEGQEEKLLDFSQYLNEKDRKTLEMLKESKVMQDSQQDPLIRVCLRNLKDFAKPFALDKEEKELFWKYFLITDAEAVFLAKEILKKTKAQAAEAVQEQKKEEKKEKIEVEEAPKEIPKREEIKKVQKIAPEEKKQQEKEPEEFIKLKEDKPKKRGKQTSLVPAADQAPKATPGSFADKVFNFLAAKNITVKEVIQVKKGELTCIITVPSPVGTIAQFCKAKDKKTISDGELATTILEGQQHAIPVLFIATGSLSKKAQAIIEQGTKNVSFVKM